MSTNTTDAIKSLVTAAKRNAALERKLAAMTPRTTHLSSVLEEIAEERNRQDEKWGEQNHPDGTGPTIPTLNAREHAIHECDYAHSNGTGTWRHILEEEYREALAESDPAKLRAELIQMAAVAVAWIQKIDRTQNIDTTKESA